MLVTIISVLSLLFCVFVPEFSGFNWLWKAPLAFLGSFLVLTLVSVGFLWGACQLVDTDKPRTKDSPFYRRLAAVYIEALIQLLQVRIHVSGLEKFPEEGRVLLVCNHLFVADPGVLLHVFQDKQLAFISKKENRDLFVVGRIMHAMLCQCLDRENDRAALKTILECIRIVREDEASIAVFPEGATNHDNYLHPFRPGAFRIAQKANVPIVVCTLEGTRDILRNGLRLKHTDVNLRLAEVLRPEDLKGMKTTEISDRVWEIMKNHLGPGYQPVPGIEN